MRKEIKNLHTWVEHSNKLDIRQDNRSIRNSLQFLLYIDSINNFYSILLPLCYAINKYPGNK